MGDVINFSDAQRAAEDATPWVDRLRQQSVDSEQLDDMPEPAPLVPGMLYRDTIAWLFGPPGSGKSFISLDLAGCVGTGENWQGLGAPTKGAVLYVVAEGVGGIRRRVRAWEAAMGTRMGGVRFLPVAVQVTNAAAWEGLVEYACEIGATLIVLDTQARVTVGLEENSAKEMGRLVEAVERLRAATGACVLVVHHTGRGGEHMRGSIALDGAASTMLKVTRTEDMIELEVAKQKDAIERDPLNLRLVPHEPSAVISIMGYPFINNESHPLSRAVEKMLMSWWATFETDWVTPKTMCEITSTARPTYFRAIKRLVDSGVVETKGDGHHRQVRLIHKPEYQSLT